MYLIHANKRPGSNRPQPGCQSGTEIHARKWTVVLASNTWSRHLTLAVDRLRTGTHRVGCPQHIHVATFFIKEISIWCRQSPYSIPMVADLEVVRRSRTLLCPVMTLTIPSFPQVPRSYPFPICIRLQRVRSPKLRQWP